VKDCILWEGSHAGAGQQREEERAAETKHCELTTPVAHLPAQLRAGGGGGRVRSEVEPGKKEVGGR